MPSPPIFISYRRNDAGGHAGRLFDALKSEFGNDSLYYDRCSITPGEAFPSSLEAAIDGASVVLVIIGTDW